jgi:hypothetical protein
MSREERFSHPAIVPKCPGWREVLRGAALAILTVVLVCPQGGCLVPQSIEPKNTVPHPPPHFVVEAIPTYLTPPILTLDRQGTVDASQTPPCHCVLDFGGLVVEEDDPTITLEARWFIDYDVTVPSSLRVWTTDRMDGTFNDPTATQRNLRVFSFDADEVLILTSGQHVVEVVVGEVDGFDPSSTTQPNRAMKPGYTAALYRFFVDVHVEQIPGQCPQTPPSRRVCQ